MRTIKEKTVYRDFKGNYYYVKNVFQVPVTNKQYVIYEALYGNCKTWFMELNMFLSPINQTNKDNVTNQKWFFEEQHISPEDYMLTRSLEENKFYYSKDNISPIKL